MRYKLNLLLLALAAVMVLGSGIQSAYAYFTTYCEAKGGYEIDIPGETEVKEEFSAWTKRVSVKNEGGSGPVFVRARAFCTAKYPLTFSWYQNEWADGGDGWYYYGPAVAAGESSGELLIKIENVPRTAEPGDDFNVVVVYETTPVLTRDDGTTWADWTGIANSGSSSMTDSGEGGQA